VVKVLKEDLGRNEQIRRRFVREARYVTSLDHPNIVRVLRAGEQDGVSYIVMQYVRGSDLRTRLANEGVPELAEVIALLTQVAEALDAAHASGVLHRDVKPGNVLIASGEGSDPEGRCYLTDFGLSKDPGRDSGALTASGEFVGSVLYAAPEQMLATELSARADVYSFGCVLYECIVGEPPFGGGQAAAVMQAHLESPPPRPSKQRPGLAFGLDAVVARALAKDPAERYASCGELIGAAREALHLPRDSAEEPAEAGPRKLSLRLMLDFDAPAAALRLGDGADEISVVPEGGRWRIAR
jgi:serine/threonine-protein kinase